MCDFVEPQKKEHFLLSPNESFSQLKPSACFEFFGCFLEANSQPVAAELSMPHRRVYKFRSIKLYVVIIHAAPTAPLSFRHLHVPNETRRMSLTPFAIPLEMPFGWIMTRLKILLRRSSSLEIRSFFHPNETRVAF